MILYKYKLKKKKLLARKALPKKPRGAEPARRIRFAGGPLPKSAKLWCLMYESVLRKFYPECKTFDNTIIVGRKFVYLNGIDSYSSSMIEKYLDNPSKRQLELLTTVLSTHSLFPEIIAIVTCRNLGIPYSRLASDSGIAASYKWMFTRPGRSLGIPSKDISAKSDYYSNRLDVVLDLKKRVILRGQLDPFASAAAIERSANKIATNRFIGRLGYKTPRFVAIRSKEDLEKCKTLRTPIFIKPAEESLRTGVIGPITDYAQLNRSYARAVSQITSSNVECLCQECVEGEEFRINYNFGKVTFVAKSIIGYVIGDGEKNVAQLLEERRKKYKIQKIRNDYIDNILMGSGLSTRSVPERGKKVRISLNGSEEGRFVDVTDSFKEKYKRQIRELAKDLQLNIIGVDVIIDKREVLWIIDVNNSPYLTFFDKEERSYATMEHMVKIIVRKIGRK